MPSFLLLTGSRAGAKSDQRNTDLCKALLLTGALLNEVHLYLLLKTWQMKCF